MKNKSLYITNLSSISFLLSRYCFTHSMYWVIILAHAMHPTLVHTFMMYHRTQSIRIRKQIYDMFPTYTNCLCDNRLVVVNDNAIVFKSTFEATSS